MSTTRKFLRNMDKVTLSNLGKATKMQKVVSTVTAMGFVLQPVAAMAQIVRADTKGTEVKFENGVAKVWAEKVINENVAMNVFKDFKVDANNIANMYFMAENGNLEASNLVNFVNSRIDINGTVNAIKGGKIGGNLFFLSSDGMAVGASGVINAGALYVATPTQSAYDMYKSDAMLEKLVNVKEQDGFASIPINASGTISVLGKVNAINEVQLRAAKIGVGKNVSGTTGYMEANATSQDAYIKTGMAFTQVVNTGKYNVDDTVTAKIAGTGDIVLAASADMTNTDTGFASALGSDVHGNDTVQASVDIAQGAQLITAKQADGSYKGNIEITADASNDKTLLGKLESTTVADLLGAKVSKVEAKINIDGKLKANNINIAANAENSYENDSWTNMGFVSGALADSAMELIPVDGLSDTLNKVDIAFAKLASNAEVKIGSHAALTATGDGKLDAEANDDGLLEGGALNISATSKLKAEVGAEVEAPDAPEAGEGENKGKAVATTTPTPNKKTNKNSLSSIMPSAGISVVDTSNNASIKIEGVLESNGDTSVSAHAINEVKAESTVSTLENESGEAGSLVNAAVTVAKISNTSNVELKGSNTKVTDGDLNVASIAKNSVTTAAVAETDKDALASTAVNVTAANSSANLTIGGEITATNMNLVAQNTVSNEIQAATQVGQSKFKTKSQISGGTLNAILGKVNNTKAKNNTQVSDGLGKYITAGAAVNIVDENNSAKVTVLKGAKLTAAGATQYDEAGEIVPNVNIAANNTIEDSFMSATSVVNNFGGNKGNTTTSGNVTTGETTEQALLASVGLLQADMNNNAQVIIEASDEQGKSAPEIKGANVDISANSSFEYDRLKSMWENIKNDWADKVTEGAAKTLYDKIAAKIAGHTNGDIDDALAQIIHGYLLKAESTS